MSEMERVLSEQRECREYLNGDGPGRDGAALGLSDLVHEECLIGGEYQATNRYRRFMEQKAQLGDRHGFKPLWMPSFLFDFQAYLAEWNLEAGRSATLADCGTGKTPIELVWAENVVRFTNKPVLFVTPVAPQAVREAEKFQVECYRSRDGIRPAGARIIITNYERLHYFDPNDFAGMVLDECFPPDTLVDTSLGSCYIKDIRQGDRIVNVLGDDEVSSVHRREVFSAIRITVGSNSITSSPNHPYFTQRGWVGAQDLRPGDSIMETGAAMRLVWHGSDSGSEPRGQEKVLREILFSEMADGSTVCIGAGSFRRSSCTARSQAVGMASFGESTGYQGIGSHCDTEPNGQSRDQDEGLPDIEGHEPQTFRSWWQWTRPHGSASVLSVDPRTRMDSGVRLVVGEADSWLSHELQARLRKSRAENRYRSGWTLSSLQERSGLEEGCQAGFARVDGLEVLEPGHPDLERYRDAEGRIYFYDLGATRHPSFSVNGLLVHNSSILKSFDGARRSQITEFMRVLPYRLLGTATAAPNDYIELGTSSEALGQLGYLDMLNRFFKNDQNTIQPMRKHIIGKNFRDPPPMKEQWRFKGHAEIPFMQWVCSWARAGRKPSDFGPFSDEKFILPPLIERQHLVKAMTLAPGMLFSVPAIGLQEQREERRRTIKERCEKLAELSDTKDAALIWCHLNPEGDLLEKLVPGGIQISGKDSDEAKDEKFMAFLSGQARALITKEKIGAWGWNFQHCNHVLGFPSHSFEGYYQGLRRVLRFGQKRPVTSDTVTTEGEQTVLENRQRKATAANKLFSSLVAQMRHALSIERSHKAILPVEKPVWL